MIEECRGPNTCSWKPGSGVLSKLDPRGPPHVSPHHPLSRLRKTLSLFCQLPVPRSTQPNPGLPRWPNTLAIGYSCEDWRHLPLMAYEPGIWHEYRHRHRLAVQLPRIGVMHFAPARRSHPKPHRRVAVDSNSWLCARPVEAWYYSRAHQRESSLVIGRITHLACLLYPLLALCAQHPFPHLVLSVPCHLMVRLEGIEAPLKENNICTSCSSSMHDNIRGVDFFSSSCALAAVLLCSSSGWHYKK